ncbi:MAG: helix-turn-helix domain-containing protein [Candidatus Eremiobacteraeota bacterium]|nr:helix-turn-helix domain-containing protein [Candidatus Eremiobacteraeota bacterium]
MSATFAHVLRRLRRNAGLSQEALAEHAGLSKDAISALERGTRRAPHLETVEHLADALELDSTLRLELEAAASRARERKPFRAWSSQLPTFATSLTGRDNEVADLRTILENERLVTVTGTGGIGKTRVAVSAAEQVAAARDLQIAFVDLAAVRVGTDVSSKIASALGVRIAGSGDAVEELVASLKTHAGLVILDNCEHVIDDTARVAAAVFRTCRNLALLATSRERLAVDGEHIYRLGALTLAAAVELFELRVIGAGAQHASTSGQREITEEICGHLDGIPLAIELAAARVPFLGLGELRARLRGQRAVLVGGRRDAPARHQTMDDTVAWSYALLESSERALFRRLSLFAGGWNYDAVAQVAAGSGIDASSIEHAFSSLLEKSLVNADIDVAPARFRLLEPVRVFARSQLEAAGELVEFSKRHAEWIAKLATSARNDVTLFGMEIDNARAALEWTLTVDDAVAAARIVGGLGGAWARIGLLAECRRWCERVLEKLDGASYPELAASVYRALIVSMGGKGEITAILRAIPFSEAAGDWNGVAVLTSRLALRYGEKTRFSEAERAFTRVWQIRDREGLGTSSEWATVLMHRASVYRRQGRLDEAEDAIAQSLTLARALGKPLHEMWTLMAASGIAFARGQRQRAIALASETLELARANRHTIGEMGSRAHLAAFHVALGDPELARVLARATILQGKGADPRVSLAAALHLAAAEAVDGDPMLAAQLKGYVDNGFKQEELALDPMETSSYGILDAALRERLDAESIERHAREGRSFDAEDVAELAFSADASL